MESSEKLFDLIMAHYDNAECDTPCRCGKGLRVVKCHDCFEYPISCAGCFSTNHRNIPFHWALVWNAEKQHFSKASFCEVASDRPSGFQLGHNGDHCPSASQTDSFENVSTIVHI